MNGGQKDDFIAAMKKYIDPYAGYGDRFGAWITSDNRKALEEVYFKGLIIPFDYSIHILIFLPTGSNYGFKLFHIRTGKVAEKPKTGKRISELNCRYSQRTHCLCGQNGYR